MRVLSSFALFLAVLGPACAQKPRPTQPITIQPDGLVVVCYDLSNTAEIEKTTCMVGRPGGGGAGSGSLIGGSTSTCSNDSVASQDNCYPTDTGSSISGGGSSTPVISCSQLLARLQNACPKTNTAAAKTCMQNAQAQYNQCESRGARARALVVNGGCEAVRKQNNLYCESGVVPKGSVAYTRCIAKVQEAYGMCSTAQTAKTGNLPAKR